jgi:hypothetical protein
VASSYEAERAYARRAEIAGNLLGAAVHAAAAAQTAPGHTSRLAALAELNRLAEAALAQAVTDAHKAGHPWRELGDLTGLSWQSLHRKYRRSSRLKRSKL